MFIPENNFLALQVVLMQNVFKRNYFLDWIAISNNSIGFETFLLNLEDRLRECDKEHLQAYQTAVESIEYMPENFEKMLKTHSSINEILRINLAYLKKINVDFHRYFIRELLKVKKELIENIRILTINSELEAHFRKHSSSNPTAYIAYFLETLERSEKGKIKNLSIFFMVHPMVTVILINHMETLKKLHKENLLSLKVILVQTLETESYFFEWARSFGHFDLIYSVLSPLQNALGDLDMLYVEQSTLPSTEYQRALDLLEICPEEFDEFLTTYKNISDILLPHMNDLKKIGDAFHAHCADRLFPLRTMLIQSTEHNSDFGKWIRDYTFLHSIQELSAELKDYFYMLNNQYRQDEMHHPVIIKFIAALKNMEYDRSNLICFLNKNPSVTLILTNYIKILNDTNNSFLAYIQSLSESSPPNVLTQYHLTQSKKEKEEKEKGALVADFSLLSLNDASL